MPAVFVQRGGRHQNHPRDRSRRLVHLLLGGGCVPTEEDECEKHSKVDRVLYLNGIIRVVVVDRASTPTFKLISGFANIPRTVVFRIEAFFILLGLPLFFFRAVDLLLLETRLWRF